MQLTSAPTFICDPIDGTTNFVHGYPYVCISLGLSINKIPVVGVVFNPWTSMLYTAVKGQGAYLDKTTRLPRKSKPEPLTGLNGALVAVEWGSDRKGNNFDIKTSTFRKLASEDGGMVHSLKSMGSAALNLCAVAEGTLDIYWEAGCWAWDVCAGMIILREAGGMVVDGNPGNWDPAVDGRKYLAVRAAAEGQKEIIEEFWGLIEGRFDYTT
jgi:myo-inositol-1(or 4)-monophosphatase